MTAPDIERVANAIKKAGEDFCELSGEVPPGTFNRMAARAAYRAVLGDLMELRTDMRQYMAEVEWQQARDLSGAKVLYAEKMLREVLRHIAARLDGEPHEKRDISGA